MTRPRLLLALLVLLVVGGRLLSAPRYRGVPAAPAPSRLESLSAPFGDHLRDRCTAFLGLLARSIRREGIAATGGLPLLNPTASDPEDFAYYTNHPPGIPLVTAAAFALAGEHEWVARAVALLFATATLVLLVGLVQQRLGAAAAVAAAAAAGTLPLGLYWAAHLNYEVPTIAGVLAFLILALREPPARRSRALACVVLTLAFLCDAVALFAVLAVAVEASIRRPTRLRAAAGWLGAAILLAVLWLVWQQTQFWRHGAPLGPSLRHVWQVSIFSPAIGAPPIDGFGHWAAGMAANLVAVTGGWPLAILALEALLVLVRGARDDLDRLLRATLLVAVLAWIVPAVRAFDHEYYALYYQLPLALAVARFAGRLVRPGAASLPTGSATARAVACGFLVLALLATGLWHELDRPAPRDDRPSAHRLALELATRNVGPDEVIALAPANPFDVIVLTWYTRRCVVDLPAGELLEAASRLRRHQLRPLGLETATLHVAHGTLWPGRDGWEVLRLENGPGD